MERFSDLLSEAIHRIRLCEGNKPVSVIQDELGYALGRDGGSAIAYWRKGRTPKVSDLEKLVREISRRSDLDANWVRRFLNCADYPYAENLVLELFPKAGTITPAITTYSSVVAEVSNLPSVKPYRELIGREELVGELLSKLSDPVARSVVGVDGIGGIGKTALLYEVAQQARKRDLFDIVVWANATGDSQREANALTFSTILRLLGKQLGVVHTTQQTDELLLSRLQPLLQSRRVLLVLDNLEAASQPQDELIGQLLPLLGSSSRGLLASRRRFVGDLYALHLTGLGFDGIRAFIRQESNALGVLIERETSEFEVRQIFTATGGSPLAMKLIIGQLNILPLAITLNHLQAGGSLDNGDSRDEYNILYADIFKSAWDLLTQTGKSLLLSLSLFAPGIGVNIEAISDVSGFAKNELFQTINELWRLSLLEAGEGQNGNLSDRRYYLQALTRNFAHATAIGLTPSPIEWSADTIKS